MTWATRFGRPPARATFSHAAAIDRYIHEVRWSMRASELGEVDWILQRRNCNPFRKHTPPWTAYENGFRRERLAYPNPPFPPMPDLPRARANNNPEDQPHPLTPEQKTILRTRRAHSRQRRKKS